MPAPSPMRYNVLHILSDQHQAEAVGYEGHRQAITPNLDGLAAEGVRFPNAYTNNPICTPTRVCVLSGRYCHNHGYFGLNGPTPGPELPDFLSHFGRQGYFTAAVGKLHLPNQPHHWLANRVGYHAEYTSDWNPHCEYVQWAASQGLKDEIDFGKIPDIEGRQQNEARPSKFTYRQTVEGFTNQKAMGFMSACGKRPWAMQVSYFRPHQCYTPPQEFWDLYGDDLELPHGWQDHDLSHRPPNFAQFAAEWRDKQGQYEPRDPESRYRRVWRGYLACISMVDHAVGELLDHLEKTGQADRTIVVYHSDHGAYSGMFGLPEKAPGICSEQVCRVPMVWRVPGLTPAGHVCDQLIENVDLAPTFCALAGVDPMPDVDGLDISDLLAGGSDPVRDVAVTEHVWSRSIRWKNWRFVHYQREMYDGQDIGELYDIQADPYEQTNLYHCPEHQDVVTECRRRVLEWLIRTTQTVTTPQPIPPRGLNKRLTEAQAAEYGPPWRAGAGQVHYT